MRICLLGYYGKNFGDLLMLSGILNSLYPEASIIDIISYDVLLKSAIITPLNKEINVYLSHSLGLKERISIYKSAEIIVWGGGSCFNDVDGTGAVKQMLLAKVVNPFIKIVYYGIGVDVNKNWRHKLYLRVALVIADEFKVRDSISYAKVGNYKKVSLVKDPVYLNMNYFNEFKTVHNKSRLLIAYRNVDNYFPNMYRRYLVNFVNGIRYVLEHHKFSDVVVFSCDYDYDMNDSRFIYESIKPFCNATFFEYDSVSEICKLIANSSAVITGRLHVATVANLFSTPFLLLNYSVKNLAFYKENDTIGRLIEYKDLKDDDVLFRNLKL